MISLDDALAGDYLAESRENLDAIEADLLAMAQGGASLDEEQINRVFRAVHSIKGGSGFFNLAKIGELAHKMEDVLSLIRSRKLAPTPQRVQVLLRATDQLKTLIRNVGTSNLSSVTESVAALDGICAGDSSEPHQPREAGRLRILVVEDDFASRLVLQSFLSRYGECHVAVNGTEGVEAVRSGLQHGRSYDLICMDIMMPEMDGVDAVRQMRALEEECEIFSTSGAKIIMTTAITDIKSVIRCFKVLCDSYLMKPINLADLLSQMKSYRLIA
jgi:chemotaxis protein histidine kinase CheA